MCMFDFEQIVKTFANLTFCIIIVNGPRDTCCFDKITSELAKMSLELVLYDTMKVLLLYFYFAILSKMVDFCCDL